MKIERSEPTKHGAFSFAPDVPTVTGERDLLPTLSHQLRMRSQYVLEALYVQSQGSTGVLIEEAGSGLLPASISLARVGSRRSAGRLRRPPSRAVRPGVL